MKIFLLRHGQTSYNTFQININKQFNLDYKFTTFYPFINFLNRKELIDGELTQFGIDEALENSKQSQEKNQIKVVIISPLARALQTADLFFDSNNNNDINFIVHPLLKSKFESQYDMPLKSLNCMDKYKNFNFNFIKELQANNNDWFLDDISNPSIRKKLKKKLENINEEDKVKHILKFMEEIYPNQIESSSDCVNRLFYFKKWLKKYIKDNDLKDGEVCLVAHKTIFQYFTSSDFTENLQPQNGMILQNSILTPFEFNQFFFLFYLLIIIS